MRTESQRAARRRQAKAAKRRRAELEQARVEAALTRTCPTCGVKPQVWCGPSTDRLVFQAAFMADPWVHAKRMEGSTP